MKLKSINKIQSNSRGQVSIFFSTTVLVMITFIAFIVNIGIFVKSKINLQNATDAAAYAGASVQARQLTNIGYMNWEMRNVFKEWMFKYYVLGSLNLPDVATGPSGPLMEFLMQSYTRAEAAAVDQYNFPSVCVDFANTGGVGMCTNYLVPGLPRFESSNVLGMDETTNAFVDTIVSEKNKNCSQRSKINFFTANSWAYNVNTKDASLANISDEAPQIAANFMGAFPQAFEVGLRIRNLEAQVNEPPQGNICASIGEGVDCNVAFTSLNTPRTERALKAFTTGWRNIGKNLDNAMKNSFTLREVAPKLDRTVITKNSLSTLLIPEPSPANQKYYLDLKLMTLNYATFYTAFTGGTGQINVPGNTNVSAEGQCSATKIGLPVPGYPLGFVKNPDYLTYYAVEGKSKFVGLFNPFSSQIVISAYAAAKPFGGRIGPMLFDVSELSVVKPRKKQKSSPYISALATNTFRGSFNTLPPTVLYAPGMPIPLNAGPDDKDKFWLRDSGDNVGGWIQGDKIFYGVPNMVYDYPSDSISSKANYMAPASRNVQVIQRKELGEVPSAGLYNRDIFAKFKSKLKNVGGIVSTTDINEAILAVRAPTRYEAHNYLIPTPEDLNKKIGTDSWGVITGGSNKTISDNNTTYNMYDLQLYAPIFSQDSIYKSVGELESVLSQYLGQQEAAILKYRNSMNIVAADIFNNNQSGATGQNTGREAAAALSDLTETQYASIGTNINMASSPTAKPSCKSITGKFLYFYSGNSNLISTFDSNCVTPLKVLMKARWSDSSLIGDIYSIEYALPDNFTEELFTAYRPGRDHDAGQSNGVQVNPLNQKTDTMVRNFYSTKFIPLKSVSNSSAGAYASNDFMLIYSEGTHKSISSEAKRNIFRNPIDSSTLSIEINETNH